ncbi:NAD(P)/FAD-dependent oxidoreductase [Aurantibacter sp.]|uniref:NAD(P)/FAD-dependent oxidoreductase n=1 Tax=Aurantibacter sp. TaxID=2807103 RepID=UPI0035C80273
MNYSYWEHKNWLSDIDYAIVGSGIVGLNCALQIRKKQPKAKIVILEKGVLPQGASTKNAGFACFGSLTELIDDLKTHSEAEVIELVIQRLKGLHVLRETVGDKKLKYKSYGGYELFPSNDNFLFEECQFHKNHINHILKPIFKKDVFNEVENAFGFENVNNQLFFNRFEGQIDTGKMMNSLLKLAIKKDIKILNNISVEAFEDNNDSVDIKTNHFTLKASKVLVATNGFASQLLNETVKPARAQVLITKPIKDLKVKGTFHLEQGYYYFRNINNRILLGGGRNLDFKAEETTSFNQTALIQNKLEELLKTTILPKVDFEIDLRWSGIMGVGSQKKPIVKQISNNVFCGVRLGGMGIAIGSLVGKELADLLD